MRDWLKVISLGLSIVIGIGFLIRASSVRADGLAQIPTVDIPTVTGTPMNAYVTVNKNGGQDQINVRSGPSTTDYDTVGVLVLGQTAPALGRSPGGDWVMIVYPGGPDGVGWVYSPYVDIFGNLPIIAPPPTPTPRVTATINPTFAAQFLVEITPTRLPTFTAPPPMNIPTFPVEASHQATSRVPVGFLIAGMAVVGLFGTLISFLRGR